MQLTVTEAAELIGVEPELIGEWVAQGAIAATTGPDVRVDRGELLEYAVAQKLCDPMELQGHADHEEPATLKPISLTQAVERGGILRDVAGSRRGPVLLELANRLVLPVGIERQKVYFHLENRERLGSTAIGGGYAIPHSRQALLPGLIHSSITIGLLLEPVAWNALDNKPVHTVFVLMSQNLREHVGLLPRIVYALRDPELRTALEARASNEEIMTLIKKIEAGMEL